MTARWAVAEPAVLEVDATVVAAWETETLVAAELGVEASVEVDLVVVAAVMATVAKVEVATVLAAGD